jgi:hypothetical protein
MASSRKIESQPPAVKVVQPEPDAAVAPPVETAVQPSHPPITITGAVPPPAAASLKPTVSAGLRAANLRIDPNIETSTVKRLLTRVGVERRPDKQLYVRVHPDPTFRSEKIGLLEFTRDRRLYLVDPPLSELLKPYYKRFYVFTATTITRTIFLWVVPMPGDDGTWNAWPQSMYDCARVAEDRWLQVHSGANYEPHILEEPKPDPDWPTWLHPCTTFDQLIDLAFAATYINKIDHPVIEALLHGK